MNVNIYENVIKLTSAKGIPRQIINGKLLLPKELISHLMHLFYRVWVSLVLR